ncbi:MAG: co-chaperone GroES [Candidatus Ryanbacteria bacterium CG10_big_fil_rev_8_21_14_0_10_43_42]|uniref:Co-chaperonin GroES n=1 Tax=Candidatus Ryanbacteria bacterium CG10_big_fil_rev_8_21_14_0_10_43_42 TaxID=1974864 RepID=A0A2M8KXN5_9BACT|nr:MAG: co-chaperone GroES [Candidatus Ryanbacteria bacterium CG10_big_fil_rev_8_21_14_0_10_43_42]
MNLQPTEDRIIVEVLPRETKTASGLYLPDTAKDEETLRGTVIAVGEGRKNDAGTVIPLVRKVGEMVLFTKSFNSNQVKEGEKEYVVIREGDIIAVIK